MKLYSNILIARNNFINFFANKKKRNMYTTQIYIAGFVGILYKTILIFVERIKIIYYLFLIFQAQTMLGVRNENKYEG